MKKDYTLNSEQSFKDCYYEMWRWWSEKKYLQITANDSRRRTNPQNRALHKYCQLLADELNAAGHHMRVTVHVKEAEIDWSMQLVKDVIWREIQKAVVKKESTAELTTVEIQQVYETVNRFTSDRFGIGIEWPHYEQD